MLCQTRPTYPQSVHCRISSSRLWVVVERNLWGRWRLYMWQNILVWLCWTCSMWYLGCCSEIMWWKLTVDFVISKTVPNSHTSSTQCWQAAATVLINISFSEHHGEAVPVCCSSSFWQHRLCTNCTAESLFCSLLSTFYCVLVLVKQIYPSHFPAEP